MYFYDSTIYQHLNITGNRTYFKGLDGVRTIAAFLVFVSHIDYLKYLFGIENNYHVPQVFYLGRTAVTMFFVLSGFLITYRLLAEKQKFTSINLRNFYIRRALRIWPLYYLVLGLGFLVFPNLEFLEIPFLSDYTFTFLNKKLFLFLLFCPQLVLVLFPPIPFLEPLWSIGVEELFYVFWPLIVKFKNKIFGWIIGVIVFFNLIKGWLLYQVSIGNNPTYLFRFSEWNDYLYFTRIDCVLIGSIGGFLVFKKHGILKFVYSKFVQILILISFIFVYLFGFYSDDYNQLLYSILFVVVLLNIAANPDSIIQFNANVFHSLGRLSYSFYLLHEVAIVSVIYILKNILKIDVGSSYWLLFFSSLLLSFILSLLSYYCYEQFFLKLKTKFKIDA